jgi:GDP-4-dehydro-6-deoxy-D-mannose reductase
MRKILVTGANGFVGQHLVKELSEHGLSVTGVGGPTGATEKSPFVDDYLVLDLNDAAAVRAIDFSGIGGVIHLAGLAAIGPSFERPMDYITTNIGIETNLFEAALAQDAHPRFLIISSATLYDPQAPQPLDEQSPVLPNSPYAVSKLGQEQMARYYAVARGFESIIARPFNHIGPGQGPGFIVPDLAQQVVAVASGAQASVRVGNLDSQRDYSDVRDIVRAYRLLLEKGRAGETYNICSGTPLSGHDILQGLSQAAGCDDLAIKEDSDKMRPSDTPLIVGSHDKLTADTGWQPEIPLETTLTDVIADWRDRRQAS